MGEECGCDPCGVCCDWLDEDWSLDTIELGEFDQNIIDLQLNYTLTNWGGEPTNVWVMLCDDYGCEEVIDVDLLPGEMISQLFPLSELRCTNWLPRKIVVESKGSTFKAAFQLNLNRCPSG